MPTNDAKVILRTLVGGAPYRLHDISVQNRRSCPDDGLGGRKPEQSSRSMPRSRPCFAAKIRKVC